MIKKHVFGVGDIFQSKNCGEFSILECNGSLDTTVRFTETGYIKYNVATRDVRVGNINDPYARNCCSVGYLGEGEYVATIGGKSTPAYRAWTGMLYRGTRTTRPSYSECSVCKEWENFQVFAEWFYSHCIGIPEPEVDKDLLFCGNKHYSPETCVIIPPEINNFLVGRPNKESSLPVGVAKHHKKFRAQGNFFGEHYQGMSTHSVLNAFNEYKELKEKYAKHLAEQWQGILDDRAITALNNYKVTTDYKFSDYPEPQKTYRVKSLASNSTGVVGVCLQQPKSGERFSAYWYDNKVKSKSFSTHKYGYEEAFRLACEYRTKMIEELNAQGAGYSPTHGQ